jgi:hypothetical protein
MIYDSLIVKFAEKYDENFMSWTKEEYENCMKDPECYSKYRQESANRGADYYERHKSDPNSALNIRKRQQEEAYKSMKQTGALDGLALILATKIKSIKSHIVKSLKNKIVSSETSGSLSLEDIASVIERNPTYKKFMQDANELYYLRDKTVEFAQTLKLVEPGKPLRPEESENLIKLKDLCDQMSTKFGNTYKTIVGAIQLIVDKLKTIAAGMILWK